MKANKGTENIFYILQGILWLMAVCVAVWVFILGIEPVNVPEILFPEEQTESEVLYSGDSITQKFRADYDRLDGFDIILSYEDSIPSELRIKISLLRNGEAVMEQPLPVNICRKGELLHLKTEVSDCLGEELTILVENISDPSVEQGFTLLTTRKDYLFPENTDNYYFNGEEKHGRLLGMFFYNSGFRYYKSFTYVFWVFLGALLISGEIHQAALKRQRSVPQSGESDKSGH